MGGYWARALLWFVVILALLLLAALLRAAWLWRQVRRLGVPLGLRTFLTLRRRGVHVPAVAAAHWTAQANGYDVPLDVWASFAVLRVDVVRLSAALAWARQHGLATVVGTLGAAALAGYDPLEVAEAAHARHLTQLDNACLTQLDTWGLTRQRRPV